jgi:hypothetical protein
VVRACPFDVRQVPFSTRGAWISLSPVVGLHTSSDDIHLDSHVNGLRGVLRFEPQRDGSSVTTEWVADATRFAWVCDDGTEVQATFSGPSSLRLRGSGLGLRVVDPEGELTSFTGAYLFVDPVDGAAVLTSYETGRRYRIRSLSGALAVEGAERLGRAVRAVVLGGDDGCWEAEITECRGASVPGGDLLGFDELLAENDSVFRQWVDRVAPWRSERTPAALLACYVVWSAIVSPEGEVTRETVLMSKHWMNRVWSWDHAFNALALAGGEPDLALDQFLAPFDHQDETGAIPDSIGHSDVLCNFVKPPIHGWAFRRLRADLGRAMTRDELAHVHDRLAAWTRFWLDHRRAPGHALPHYQHGNDSGWDNATTFDVDRVVESPDLAAYLILQLEVLEELGRELDRPVEPWTGAREELAAALVGELWTRDGFAAVGTHSGTRMSSTSLLMLMPFVLADRLPESVRKVMVQRLDQHLTDFGAATEPPTSPAYDADGYWRGPIWAPSTALLEAGLREAGHVELADTISARFRSLCERSGFAENFDARSGEGLRDRAYTWTAAVYLMLCASAAGVESR